MSLERHQEEQQSSSEIFSFLMFSFSSPLSSRLPDSLSSRVRRRRRLKSSPAYLFSSVEKLDMMRQFSNKVNCFFFSTWKKKKHTHTRTQEKVRIAFWKEKRVKLWLASRHEESSKSIRHFLIPRLNSSNKYDERRERERAGEFFPSMKWNHTLTAMKRSSVFIKVFDRPVCLNY